MCYCSCCCCFLNPRFIFEAKFSFPGSLSFCTEALCLGLGNFCHKARRCLFVQVVSFLLSVALFPDIWTIRGLLTSLALDLRLKAGRPVLWVREEDSRQTAAGPKEALCPQVLTLWLETAVQWSPVLASYRHHVGPLLWRTLKHQAYQSWFFTSLIILLISQTTSAYFVLFYVSILEILNHVSHSAAPTKLSESLWKLFHGPAFSNPSGLPSDKNDWYPQRDLHFLPYRTSQPPCEADQLRILISIL